MNQRLYADGGRLAHLVPFAAALSALCGTKPWPGQWHGHSNPAERDTATAMPLCVDCRHRAVQPRPRRKL